MTAEEIVRELEMYRDLKRHVEKLNLDLLALCGVLEEALAQQERGCYHDATELLRKAIDMMRGDEA